VFNLRFNLAAVLSLALLSCGIDSVNYLAYVPEVNVTKTANYRVDIINLPDGPGHGQINSVSLDFTSSQVPSITSSDINTFHSNFQIYYRIYISNMLLNSTINESDMTAINTVLYSDFSALKPYTVVTNNYTASVGSAFAGRNYWAIGEDSNPNLLRSRQLITPYPSNRLFFNDSDLKNPSYLNSNNNADVVANSNGNSYTYVSMYVVHTAFSDVTLTPYYSSPTFLGVYLLPDTINTHPVSFTAVANGTPTNSITLTFSEVIPGLIASDIVVTDDVVNPTGITTGALSGSGTTYTLAVSGTGGAVGDITIALNKPPYVASAQTVTVQF
jgi:hypothetical protein